MDKLVLEGRWEWDTETSVWDYYVGDRWVYFIDPESTSKLLEHEVAGVQKSADNLVNQLDPLGRITIKHPTELPVFREVTES